MPLAQGYTMMAIGTNIGIERHAGRSAAQAAAIAYRMARQAWRTRHPRAPFPDHLRQRLPFSHLHPGEAFYRDDAHEHVWIKLDADRYAMHAHVSRTRHGLHLHGPSRRAAPSMMVEPA